MGGLIGEYVVETRGRAALRDLVRTNGALQPVLGVDEAGFVSAWFAHVSERHGLSTAATRTRPFLSGGEP